MSVETRATSVANDGARITVATDNGGESYYPDCSTCPGGAGGGGTWGEAVEDALYHLGWHNEGYPL